MTIKRDRPTDSDDDDNDDNNNTGSETSPKSVQPSKLRKKEPSGSDSEDFPSEPAWREVSREAPLDPLSGRGPFYQDPVASEHDGDVLRPVNLSFDGVAGTQEDARFKGPSSKGREQAGSLDKAEASEGTKNLLAMMGIAPIGTGSSDNEDPTSKNDTGESETPNESGDENRPGCDIESHIER